MGSYIPNTGKEQLEMLKSMGYSSMDDLFAAIPDDMKLKDGLDLPEGKSELEVSRIMKGIAAKNRVFSSIFRGAGAYNHYIPAVVSSVLSNESVQTAYTPYQAEISQGLLQSIFEYQTMICDLTGMDASNASVYDGAEAAAEGIAMCRDKKRNRALISAAVLPAALETVKTYCFGNEMELEIIPEKNGVTDLDYLKEHMDKSVACVYIQHPNYYGNLEDAEAIGEIVHESGAKYIMGVNPISLGVLKTPAEYGADIAVGEGQPGTSYGIRRPVSGFHGMPRKDDEKTSGTYRGSDGGCRRQDRIRADFAGQRTAYPSRKSIQQYLLQPGTVRTGSRRLPGSYGQRRAGKSCDPVHVKSPLPGRSADRSRLCSRKQRRLLP